MSALSRRAFLAATASTLVATPQEWLVGANTAIQGYSLDRSLSLLADLQFPVVEIHPMGRPEATPKVFPGFTFDHLTEADKRTIKQSLRPFRKITGHLPYTGLNWMSEDATERQRSLRAVDIAIEGSAYFGASMAVLHPQPVLEWKPRAPQYVDTIGRWADRCRELGIRIAMESGFAPSVAEFVEFVRTVNHSNVGVTVDVGHQSRYAELVTKVRSGQKSSAESIRAYNDTTLDIISRLASKVFHLHVHDIDPNTWQEHKPMAHGFVDYPRIFEQLRKVRYSGVLILEIGGDPEQMPLYLKDARKKFVNWLS